jgi:iron(III) transport system ATP-binding protein
MVTHDQEEALTMADRIVVMNRGAIEQIGSPLEIYRERRSLFVADFIGLMNFVGGTMVGPGTVRCGGPELACEADGYPPGTPVTVAIRPEDIGLHGVQADEENYRTRFTEVWDDLTLQQGFGYEATSPGPAGG